MKDVRTASSINYELVLTKQILRNLLGPAAMVIRLILIAVKIVHLSSLYEKYFSSPTGNMF